MRRILRWLVGLPLVVLVLGFAIANRRWVTLSFDPFTQDSPRISMDLPLWLLFFMGIFVGLIVGYVAAWIAQGKHRKAARDARQEVSRLQVEVADLKSPQATAPMQDIVPFNGGIL